MTKDDKINALLLFATFKSFHEQLYNLKGIHKQEIKKYFNALINAANKYEKTLKKYNSDIDNAAIEEISDGITDVIYMIREQVNERK